MNPGNSRLRPNSIHASKAKFSHDPAIDAWPFPKNIRTHNIHITFNPYCLSKDVLDCGWTSVHTIRTFWNRSKDRKYQWQLKINNEKLHRAKYNSETSGIGRTRQSKRFGMFRATGVCAETMDANLFRPPHQLCSGRKDTDGMKDSGRASWLVALSLELRGSSSLLK